MTVDYEMRVRGTSARGRLPVVEPEDSWHLSGGGLPADALVLAIDTSSKTGGVALTRGAAVVGEEAWLAGGSQTSHVLPAIARLCARAGVAVAAVKGVVVAIGPGSFTGLRVGASLGKGFALALGIPLAGVPTLDAVAYQHRQGAANLCAVVDTGRGQLYAGRYIRWRGRLRRAADFAVCTVDELAAAVGAASRPILVCGELDAAAAAALRRSAGGRLRLASPAANLRRPAYLAELGRWRLAQPDVPDPAALQPIYLRRAPAPAP